MSDDTPMIDVTLRLPLASWEAFTFLCSLRQQSPSAALQHEIAGIVKHWELAADIALMQWLTAPPQHKEP